MSISISIYLSHEAAEGSSMSFLPFMSLFPHCPSRSSLNKAVKHHAFFVSYSLSLIIIKMIIAKKKASIKCSS